ncbi:MAG: AAA family ATPase [Candidatus Gastranaerophilaceae bacterium]
MNERMFIMMIGLSASGKSTCAKAIKEATIISSDEIRKELFGDYKDQKHNHLVFEEMRKRIKQSLLFGETVVCDATNLTIKDRKCMLDCVNSIPFDCKKIAIVCPKSIENCIKDNKYRPNPVPEYVIYKQAKRFQIPFKEEGFDEIILNNLFDILKTNGVISRDFQKTIIQMVEYNQGNPNHKYTLGTHCMLVSQMLWYDDVLKYSGIMHDYGKMFTKTVDINNISHYYSHANVGAYILLCNPNLLPHKSVVDFLDELFYINYHMNVFDWKNEKTKIKYQKIFGINKYNNLLKINRADIYCSKGCGE